MSNEKGISAIVAVLAVSTVTLGIGLTGAFLHYSGEVHDLRENINAIESEYSQLKSYNQSLLENYEELERLKTNLEENLEAERAEYENLVDNFSRVKSELETLKEGNRFELHAPTFSEVKSFIEKDGTDLNEYDEKEFNCFDYTEQVIDHAMDEGLMSGFVRIIYRELSERGEYSSKTYAHALVAFDTADEEIVYVEPQNDVIMKNLEEGEYYWDLIEEYSGMDFTEYPKWRIEEVTLIW